MDVTASQNKTYLRANMYGYMYVQCTMDVTASQIRRTLGTTNLGHNKFGYNNFGYHNFSHKFRKFSLDLGTFQRRANITYISYIS